MESAPVSVIIPCYRCKDTLLTAVNSVLNQTLLPKEILLIEDASGDGTLELLRDLEARLGAWVRVIAQKQNGGPGIARNAGWEAASQPWLAFLDADDVWHPRKLEVQWAWLSSHSEVVLCGHSTKLSDGDVDHPVTTQVCGTRLTLGKMLVSNRLPTRSVMLRRDLPFRFGGRGLAEDFLLWLQIISTQLPAYRLNACLAYSLRPDFSAGGYSGQLWKHEKRELKALIELYSGGGISRLVWVVSSYWSFIKFLRRCVLIRLI
jgi:glycosyltransferase involved in cell wall biosynthesis